MFFEILSANSHIRISLKSVVSVNKSFAYQSFYLQQALFIDAHLFLSQRRIRIVSYILFSTFREVACLSQKKKFLLQIVHRKTNTTKFSNLENDVMVVYIRSIKNVRSSMQSSHFQHHLSISWSILFQDFFRVVMCQNFHILKVSGVFFFISIYPFRLINLSRKFDFLFFTYQL